MFSIIIPNYNRAQSIIKSIRSVLNQTYTNFELIIVDDCSTDNSLEEISKIKDERIIVYQLKNNSGPAVARNYGISNSKGNYISFLDSDDHYENTFLESTFNILNNSSDKIGFTWTGIRLHEGENTKEQIWDPKLLEDTYHTFLNGIQIGTSAGTTVKREVFETCGLFNENLLAAEDTEFFLRISQSFDFLVIKKMLVNIYRSNDDRLSKNFKKIAIAYNKFMPIHFAEINKSTELRNKYYYKMMWLNYYIPDSKTAKEYKAKIKPESFKDKFKINAIYLIYNLLDLKTASVIHKKISKSFV